MIDTQIQSPDDEQSSGRLSADESRSPDNLSGSQLTVGRRPSEDRWQPSHLPGDGRAVFAPSRNWRQPGEPDDLPELPHSRISA